MNQYLMIPRSIIDNRQLGDKRAIIYSSIFFSGLHPSQTKELVKYSRFSTCRDKTGVMYQYKTVIESLYSIGLLDDDRDGFYIKPDKGFGAIYADEFQRIISERDRLALSRKRINHANIILLLVYIRSRMIRSAGVPEFYSDLLSRMAENTGISVRSISACLDALENLNIIHHEELPRYQSKDGIWHANVKIFVNMESHEQSNSPLDWKAETERGIKYIMARQKTKRRNS